MLQNPLPSEKTVLLTLSIDPFIYQLIDFISLNDKEKRQTNKDKISWW